MLSLQPQQTNNKPTSERKTTDSLRKAAQDFEAIFINYLLKTMRRSIPNSNLFGDGISGEFYKGLFDETLAKAVARKNGLGLADKIITSLDREHHLKKTSTGKNLIDYRAGHVKNSSKSYDTDTWDRRIIADAASCYRLEPKLVEAVIKVESGYRANALSPKGAAGLMQLMASTAFELGVKDRYDPIENVYGGAKYLRNLLDRFKGNLRLALAAYNAGPTAVEKHNGIPPYPETERYVEKVLQAYRDL